MRVGFIGLGNVGSKLAGSLLRNEMSLIVRDLTSPGKTVPGWRRAMGQLPC